MLIVYFSLFTWKNTCLQGEPYTNVNKEKNLEINTYMYALEQKSYI